MRTPKFILPLFLLTACSAFASFNFSLTNSPVSTYPGGIADPTCFSGSLSCVIFQASILSSVDVDLTDLVINFTSPANPSPYLTYDADFFFSPFAPAFLVGGVEYDGPLFEIDVLPVNIGDPFTPLGAYLGNVTIIGGPDGGPFTALNTPVDFEIDVATPEPSTWLLMLVGLGTFGAVAWKRRAASVRG